MALIKTHFKTPLSFSRKRESGFSVNLRMTQTRGFELVSSLKLFSFKKGVTLTELLVATAIASGVSLGIISIYIAHYRIFTNQNALIQAETQNRIAIDFISKLARESFRFSFETTGEENDKLGLTLLPLDANGNPYNPGLYDHVIIQRDEDDNSKLIVWGTSAALSTSRSIAQINHEDPDYLPGKVIATGINDFDITYNNPVHTSASQATINLITEATTIYGKKFTSTQSFTIYLNKND